MTSQANSDCVFTWGTTVAVHTGNNSERVVVHIILLTRSR